MYNLLLLLLLLLSVRWLILCSFLLKMYLYSLHSLNLYRMESWIQTITTTKMLSLELNSMFHIVYISHWMEWFICFTIFFINFVFYILKFSFIFCLFWMEFLLVFSFYLYILLFSFRRFDYQLNFMRMKKNKDFIFGTVFFFTQK